MTNAQSDALSTLVAAAIYFLPFMGYYYFGEAFEVALLGYLAIIAYRLDPVTEG